MKKRKPAKGGLDDQRAVFEDRPDMANLDAGLREILRIPKGELDARIEAERSATKRRK